MPDSNGRIPTEDRAFRDTPGSGPERDPDRSSHGTAPAWPALIGFVGLSVLLGLANAAAIPAASQSWLLSLARPPGMPPADWIAPVAVARVWAALSLPSGLAAWLAWRRPGHRRGLLLWGWQLLAHAAWAQCLLALRMPGLAVAAVFAHGLLAATTAGAFTRLRAVAGLLLLPMLAWTCYALYVTAGLWWLNRG